jgi:hypothetical protein
MFICIFRVQIEMAVVLSNTYRLYRYSRNLKLTAKNFGRLIKEFNSRQNEMGRSSPM